MTRFLILDNLPQADHAGYGAYSDEGPVRNFILEMRENEDARAKLLFPHCEIVRIRVSETTTEELSRAINDANTEHIHITGSPCSVNNHFSGIHHLYDVLSKTKRKIDTGTCYGMQFLAVLQGGKVSKLPEMRKGEREISFANGRKLMVYVNHSEYVSVLPQGAEVMAFDKVVITDRRHMAEILASGEGVFNEKGEMILKVPYIVRFADGSIGYQYHPEKR